MFLSRFLGLRDLGFLAYGFIGLGFRVSYDFWFSI